MKHLNFPQLCIIALVVFALACKKDKNRNAQPNCRLKTVSLTRTGGNTIWDFIYNNVGKVVSITTTNSAGMAVKEFNYTGSTIIALSKLAGAIYGRDSVTLDAAGRVINYRRFSTNGDWENTVLEYNGDILSKVYRSSIYNPVPDTRVATYNNGNLVSLVSTTNTATFEYFPEKTQVGDYLNLNSGMLDIGMGIYPHQSLFKNSSSGGSTTTAVYEKNADGLIVKATVFAAGSELKYDYQYDCN